MRKIRLRFGTVFIWGLLVLVLAGIVLLAILRPARQDVVETAVQPVLVRTVTIAPCTVREAVWLPGRVAANTRARLSVEKAGRVVECAVDKGHTVRAGQVLLRLDDRHWRALEQQARLELADAQRELARWEQMKASGAVADSAYDAVKQREALAVVALEQAVVHVDQCTLASPFDGVIDARLIEAGEYATEGQAAFLVLDLTPLKVQLSVPERDVTGVAPGDVIRISAASVELGRPVTADIDAPAPHGVFTGRVAFVAQDASPDRFTFAVELTVDEPPPGLRPGMIVDVEIMRAVREGAITVPLAAVIPRRGEHLAYVVENGAAVRRVVGLESLAGQDAVISRGLQAGDRLVVEGHRGLQDGVPVREDGE
jgi:membrane fusion protein (multidrug efflux system)